MARRRPPVRGDAFAGALRRHQIQVFRFAQHLNGDAQERIIGVRAKLVQIAVAADPTEPARRGDQLNRVRAASAEASRVVRGTYRGIRDRTNAGIVEWAAEEQGVFAQIATRTTGVAELDIVPPRTLERLVSRAIIDGAPSSDWWAKQATDLTTRFTREVRGGLQAGESIGDIIARVRGTGPGYTDSVVRLSQHHAESLVRSSVMSALHDTRVEQFKQNSDVVEGWAVLTTFDVDRTCDTCRGFSGRMFDHENNPLDGGPRLPSDGLPIHFSCRCVASPVLVGESAPRDLEYGAWLREQSQADQREALGPGWYAQWESGALKDPRDRIDQRGNPISLRAWKAQRSGEREAA